MLKNLGHRIAALKIFNKDTGLVDLNSELAELPMKFPADWGRKSPQKGETEKP
jgi:hypothetical protein